MTATVPMTVQVSLCCSKAVTGGTPFLLTLQLGGVVEHDTLFLLGCSHPLLVKSQWGVWPLRVRTIKGLCEWPLILRSAKVQEPVDIELYISTDVHADLSDPAQRQDTVTVQIVPRHAPVFSGSMA